MQACFCPASPRQSPTTRRGASSLPKGSMSVPGSPRLSKYRGITLGPKRPCSYVFILICVYIERESRCTGTLVGPKYTPSTYVDAFVMCIRARILWVGMLRFRLEYMSSTGTALGIWERGPRHPSKLQLHVEGPILKGNADRFEVFIWHPHWRNAT